MSGKTLFVAFLLSFASISYCQDGIANNRFFLLKINPLGVIGGDYITTSYSVSLGTEFKLNNRLTLNQSLSYILPAKGGSYLQIYAEKINGIRYDGGVKSYLQAGTDCRGYYWSSDIIYQYTDALLFAAGNERVFRNLFAMHEKFGWQSVSKKAFVFDFALGIGVRYASSKANYTDYSPSLYKEEAFYFVYPYKKPYEYGSKWFFSFNGTFSLGWRINYKKTQ